MKFYWESTLALFFAIRKSGNWTIVNKEGELSVRALSVNLIWFLCLRRLRQIPLIAGDNIKFRAFCFCGWDVVLIFILLLTIFKQK